jgi:hypothetical protein
MQITTSKATAESLLASKTSASVYTALIGNVVKLGIAHPAGWLVITLTDTMTVSDLTTLDAGAKAVDLIVA